MDDNIIEHYTNQSAFLIEISEAVAGRFQVILIEVWEPASNQLHWRTWQFTAASLNHL